MKPRIESAEILSFRLSVPKAELDRLTEGEPARLLGLTVENEDDAVVIATTEGKSALRFRLSGANAVLNEISLAEDEGGTFFEFVLTRLMTRFRGDLRVRLTWNVPDRNTDGDHNQVTIKRGILDPDFAQVAGTRLAAAAQAGAGGEPVENPSEGPGERVLTPEQREVEALLTKAREHWAEYQRLKAGKGSV